MTLPPVPEFKAKAAKEALIKFRNARFSVLTSRIIRMEYSIDGIFIDQPSQTFWYREQMVPDFIQNHNNDLLTIETDHLRLVYKDSKKGFHKSTLSITLKNNREVWHYGDKNKKANNLKGTARTLDGITGRTRLEDGLFSQKGWAVIDDSNTLIFNDQGWLEERPSQQPDLYFFAYGKDFKAGLADYTKLTGPIPMIPRYILGNWWSRYWAYTEEELKNLMLEFKENEVPLSVCIVDMDWHITKTGNQSSGWTGYTWNRELFPNPKRFIDWLHSEGLRTALNLHPAEGIHSHEATYPQMAEWMGKDPETKEAIPFDIADPHFTAGYFKYLHHPLEAEGIDFWWMDWQQGKKTSLGGLDPLWWLNHLHFQDLGRDGQKRPFIFSRWGGLGNHRYPIGFSGDTLITWASLAFQPRFTAHAANVGYGWWSHDIGGHMFKDQSPELYTRWVQYGVFSPIFRLHSTNKAHLDRRPWSKPEPHFQLTRDAMQLRHALIPYIYSMAWRAHQSGISLCTPLYYEHPENNEAYLVPDQYYFGSELIAAPVVRRGSRRTGITRQIVWLPEGDWYHFFKGDPITGGQTYTLRSKLEDIPVFAKAGAIVPMAPKPKWGGIENPDTLDLYIFPGADNHFELFEDDGSTKAYLDGKYAITRFELAQTEKQLILSIRPVEGDHSHIPAARSYRVHLRGVPETMQSELGGSYDDVTKTRSLPAFTLSPEESKRIIFAEINYPDIS